MDNDPLRDLELLATTKSAANAEALSAQLCGIGENDIFIHIDCNGPLHINGEAIGEGGLERVARALALLQANGLGARVFAGEKTAEKLYAAVSQMKGRAIYLTGDGGLYAFQQAMFA